jgi:hypothetical protein
MGLFGQVKRLGDEERKSKRYLSSIRSGFAALSAAKGCV